MEIDGGLSLVLLFLQPSHVERTLCCRAAIKEQICSAAAVMEAPTEQMNIASDVSQLIGTE